MQFYSTNNSNSRVSLKEAVIRGLAPDNGLYMPEKIVPLPVNFFENIESLAFQEIAFTIANHLLGDDIPVEELQRMVAHTIQFEAPVIAVGEAAYALELFHGPTAAFKDFGARFMSQLLGYFAQQQHKDITILVATSGDTGSAVANGFLGVDGVHVIVLYPSGKVSEIQEKQFTTLGKNITALEIDGSFDDCQRLVKTAFLDEELQSDLFLTSANSINIARLIPQSFYYFHAWAQVMFHRKPVVFSVPSGNFGNLTGGLLAKRMGLPIDRFVACTNTNDIVPEYLETQLFKPRPSIQTISNAMDVGDPSNFVRMLDLYNHSYEDLVTDIVGYSFSDDETRQVMKEVRKSTGYMLDPHGAVAYLGLQKYQESHPDVLGIFLETAHPGKFKEVVEDTLGETVSLPDRLQSFLGKEKKTDRLSNNFLDFKNFLKKR